MALDWRIEKLDCKVSENGLSNVAYRVQCICKVIDVIDGKSYVATKRVIVPLASPDPGNFTEFSNLTKTQVVEWIESSLGEEGLSTLTLELSTKNNLKANPIVVTLEPPFE